MDKFGLKIGVEGEKEFKSALGEINANFKVLKSEMNLVTSEFDKNDKSVANFTARNAVLNKEIDNQKDKISTLEGALKNSAESFGENDKRTQAWQVQLNNAKAELNNLEKEVGSNEKAIDGMSDEELEAAKNADKLGDEVKGSANEAEGAGGKFDKLGGVLKGVGAAMAAAMAAIGAAAVGAGKALYGMATDAAAAGDRIDKESQRLGMSTKAFQEWDYVISQNGGSIDSLGVGMKTLEKTMAGLTEDGDSASDAFAAVGLSFDEIKDKTPEEAFDLTVKALQNMPAGADKTAAAMKLLGKQGMELMPLLNQTAESTDALKRQANDLGMVMSDEAVGASVAFTDSMDKLNRTFSAAKNAIGAQLLPGLTQITDGLAGLIAGEDGAAESVKAGAKAIIASLSDIIPQMLDIVMTLISAIVEIAPEILGALVTAIVDNLPMLIEAATNIVMTLVDSLIDALPQITEGALQLVMSLVNGILDNLPKIIEAALTMIITLAEGIVEALPELIPAIIDTIIMIAETLLEHLDEILTAAMQIIMALAKGLIDALPKLIDKLPELINAIVDFVVNNLPMIIEMGVQLIVALAVGLIKAIPQLIKQLPQIILALVAGLGKATIEVVKVGKNIVEGLWEGIKSMVTWIKDKVSDFVGGIVDGIKGILGIHSPSKVFAGIGNNMALGLGEGFEKSMKAVERDMQRTIPTDFDLNANLNAAASYQYGAGSAAQVVDVTIPVQLDGRTLTQVVARVQWQNNNLTLRNSGIA
jgi:phage-related protein